MCGHRRTNKLLHSTQPLLTNICCLRWQSISLTIISCLVVLLGYDTGPSGQHLMTAIAGWMDGWMSQILNLLSLSLTHSVLSVVHAAWMADMLSKRTADKTKCAFQERRQQHGEVWDYLKRLFLLMQLISGGSSVLLDETLPTSVSRSDQFTTR